jgi:hypothetical protein
MLVIEITPILKAKLDALAKADQRQTGPFCRLILERYADGQMIEDTDEPPTPTAAASSAPSLASLLSSGQVSRGMPSTPKPTKPEPKELAYVRDEFSDTPF